MIKIKEAIIVEGVYDKIKLASFVDALIITTDGFRIFNNKEALAFLNFMAKKTGIIIFTDPDSAGFSIRNFIKQALNGQVKHAYIGDVYAKEKRKHQHSKEGKLGVEGVSREIILSALKNAGATFMGEEAPTLKDTGITKADFLMYGLAGGKDSAEKRRKLAKRMNLPERISANMLLDVINRTYEIDEFENIIKDI